MAHLFDHPYGFVCFLSDFEFTEALLFCQNHDLDVLDFTLHGANYIAVFSVDDFLQLLSFCEEEALNYQKFVLVTQTLNL